MKLRNLSFREAEKEGLEGLVALELAESGELSEDSPFRQEFTRHFSRNAGHLNQLSLLSQAFGEQNIQAIVLKGASMLGEIYPNLGARPMSDIDLFVRPEDHGPACVALRSLGYSHGKAGWMGPGAQVDLHTRLLHFVSGAASPYKFETDVLFGDARASKWENILVLSPEHQVLHLVVHALKHSYSRLLWLVDIARTLEQTKSTRLSDRAQETGAQRALAYAQHLLAVFELQTTVAPDFDFNPLEKLALNAISKRKLKIGWGKLLMALSLQGSSRQAYLRELVLPPQAAWAFGSNDTSPKIYHQRRFRRVMGRLLHWSGS